MADFSSVKDPGLYLIQYGTQKTGSFPIAANVYERVWHPTLDVFFPVQMDHMFVNEAYRVWHGAAHLDDALQAPLNEQHFDGYRTGATTNTPYKPGERIPGLAVGGWFDAGDFDIQGGSHAATVSSLVATWETFHPQHDQTLVDQELRFVDIHRPDGKPDVLQQIEHGALQIAAQYRSIGRLVRGIVDGELHRYHHLGDASTQTDNLIYDPSLKPYAGPTDDRSGTPDDRWVYTEPSPGANYAGIGALAAASRALRGFNDPLATECLALAKKAYAEERARPRRRRRRRRPASAAAFGPLAELSAAMQLMTATQSSRIRRPVQRARLAGPRPQRGRRRSRPPCGRSPHGRGLRGEAAAVRPEVQGRARRHAQAEPLRRADRHRRLGRQRAGDRLGDDQLLPAQGLPGPRRYRPRHPRPRLPLRHASGPQPLVRLRVGNRSKHLAYGNNRADFTFIAGGIVPGVLVLKPDYPENMDDWPFLWGENEYVIGIGASYIFLANAAQELLAR